MKNGAKKTPGEELSLFHKDSGSFSPQQGTRKMDFAEAKWCVSHLSRVISTNSLLNNVPFTSFPIPWQKGILLCAVATIPLREPGQWLKGPDTGSLPLVLGCLRIYSRFCWWGAHKYCVFTFPISLFLLVPILLCRLLQTIRNRDMCHPL